MYLAISLGRAGDIDQDGVDDFLIGADSTDQVFLLLGSGTVPTSDVDLASTPDALAFTYANLGSAVYGGQDVSGDGIPDVLMSSPNQDKTFMLMGPLAPAPPTSQPSSQPSMQPTTMPSLQPTSQPSRPTVSPTATANTGASSSTPVLTGGGIAGVVVGILVFLILLGIAVALLFAYCNRAQSEEPAAAPQYEMTQVQEA